MRLALFASVVLVSLALAACDDHDALPPPAVETTDVEVPPCEAAIDAIGWQCADGHSFSARHDLNDACVVVFEGEHTYVLPRNADGSAHTNEVVTLTQSDEFASLTGTSTGPHENCSPAETSE